MLLMGQQLLNRRVMSLRTGGQIGTVIEAIVNPHNLKIEGWFVNDLVHKRRSILLSQDIREIIAEGFVVNDESDLTDPNELVRLQSILDINFKLMSKPVSTQSKQRLGKVEDYAFEKTGYFIQKLYVSQSLVKSFSGGSAIVDRADIVEVSNRRILVADATIPSKAKIISQPANPDPIAQSAITPSQTSRF